MSDSVIKQKPLALFKYYINLQVQGLEKWCLPVTTYVFYYFLNITDNGD